MQVICKKCLQWIEHQSSFGINTIRFVSNTIKPSCLEVRQSHPSMWMVYLNSDKEGLDYTYYSFIFPCHLIGMMKTRYCSYLIHLIGFTLR